MWSTRGKYFLLLVVVALARQGSGETPGSCGNPKLCCHGRDSTCVVQKIGHNNSLPYDISDKPCYCDHACLKLNDCCADFREICDVADCVVSPWQPWGDCDTDCGTGMMTRRRTILVHPNNGGKHCPSLEQKRGCLGSKCPHNPRSALKEIAMLLSTKTSWLHENDTATNEIYDSESSDELNKEYCVWFEVLKATRACRRSRTHAMLEEGSRVCVQCEYESMRPSLGFRCTGHGTTDRSTRWTSMNSPHCHGTWLRIDSATQPHRGVCPFCREGPQFVFV